MLAITNIEVLDRQQIKALAETQFKKELDLRPKSSVSMGNVEKLHRRLDDAILLLAHQQAGGLHSVEALEACAQDICKALGVDPTYLRG
jgi:hypothetical protein